MIVEQATNLMEGGADFVFFETQPNRKALEQCAVGDAPAAGRPYVLSFAVTDEQPVGLRRIGGPACMAPLPEGVPQPIAWGMNCGTGPDGLLARSSGRSASPRSR